MYFIFYVAFLFSVLRISSDRSGNISRSTQSAVFRDIELEANSTFSFSLHGSNISGTTIVLFNKTQYKEHYKYIKTNEKFCSNNISNSILHFQATEDHTTWNTTSLNKDIYYPAIFNCNNQSFEYLFDYNLNGTRYDAKVMQKTTILYVEFSIYMFLFNEWWKRLFKLDSGYLYFITFLILSLAKPVTIHLRSRQFNSFLNEKSDDETKYLIFDMLYQVISNTCIFATLFYSVSMFCLKHFKSWKYSCTVCFFCILQSFVLYVAQATYNMNVLLIFIGIAMANYSIFCYLLKIGLTPPKYTKALVVNGCYSYLFNSGFRYLQISLIAVHFYQIGLFFLIPFCHSHYFKHVILEIPIYIIYLVNTSTLRKYKFKKIYKANSRIETKIFQQLLSKIEQCKELLKHNKYCPECEEECKDLTKQLLDNFVYKTTLNAFLKKELDAIHSKNISLSKK